MPKTTTAQEEYPAQIVIALLKKLYRGHERLDFQTPAHRRLIAEGMAKVLDILKSRRSDLQATIQLIDGDAEEVQARADLKALLEKEKKSRADYTELAGLKAYIADMDAEKDAREKSAGRAEMALRIEIMEFAENLRLFVIAYHAGPVWSKAEAALREIYEDRPVPTAEILKLPKIDKLIQEIGWRTFAPSAPPVTMCNIIINALEIALKEGGE